MFNPVMCDFITIYSNLVMIYSTIIKFCYKIGVKQCPVGSCSTGKYNIVFFTKVLHLLGNSHHYIRLCQRLTTKP